MAGRMHRLGAAFQAIDDGQNPFDVEAELNRPLDGQQRR